MSAVEPSDRDRLIALARQVAAGQGWTWLDPAEVKAGVQAGEAVWIVRTNALSLGRNIRIVFRRSDSAVLQSGFLGR